MPCWRPRCGWRRDGEFWREEGARDERKAGGKKHPPFSSFINLPHSSSLLISEPTLADPAAVCFATLPIPDADVVLTPCGGLLAVVEGSQVSVHAVAGLQGKVCPAVAPTPLALATPPPGDTVAQWAWAPPLEAGAPPRFSLVTARGRLLGGGNGGAASSGAAGGGATSTTATGAGQGK